MSINQILIEQKLKHQLPNISRESQSILGYIAQMPQTCYYHDTGDTGLGRVFSTSLEGDLSLSKHNLYRKDPVKKD